MLTRVLWQEQTHIFTVEFTNNITVEDCYQAIAKTRQICTQNASRAKVCTIINLIEPFTISDDLNHIQTLLTLLAPVKDTEKINWLIITGHMPVSFRFVFATTMELLQINFHVTDKYDQAIKLILD